MTRLDIAACCLFAQGNQMQNFLRQTVTNTSDRADSATVDESVKDLSVHSDHQQHIIAVMSDMFGRVTERIGTAEFLEANEIRKLAPQIEKEIGSGFESVIRTVVNDGRQIRSSTQHARKVRTLGCR